MKNKYINIIVFFGMLISLLVINVIKKENTFSKNENRVLTTLSDIKKVPLLDGKFDEEFEKYLSDQFVFRDSFMSINTVSKKMLGYFEINHVYFNKHNLFNKYDYTNFKYLKGNINSINEFSKKNKVNLMLVPSSSGISDNLPKYAYSDDEKKLIDGIYNKLESNNIDVYSNLKGNEDIYYKLDHHWNHNGANIGYKEIVKSLLNEEVKPFEYELVSNDFKGTIYSKSGAFWLDGEDFYKIKLNNEIEKVLIDDKEFNSIYSEDKLHTKDKYAYYLDGNHGISIIDSDVNNKKELLLFKDSYAHIVIPYLVSNYDVITMVDLRYYNDDINQLIKEDMDILFVYSLDSFINDTNLYKLSR